MTSTRRPRPAALVPAGLLAVLAVGLAVGLGGCGGDDAAGPSPDNPTSYAGLDETDATTAGEPQDTDGPDASASSAPTASTGSTGDYCTEVAGLADLGDLSRSLDDDAAIDQVLATIDDIAAAAPSEVADEWRTVVPAFRSYVAVVRRDLVDAENPPAGTTEEEATAANLDVIQQAVDELLPVQAEITAIGEHAETACGVDSF